MKRNLIALIALALIFLPCRAQEKGTLVDPRDHKTYETVKIGDQWWMASNLAYMPSVSKVVAGEGIYVYRYYGSDTVEAKKTDAYKKLGCLYDWKRANGACPAGWHLPTDAEWKQLEKHLGMSAADLDNLNWRKSGQVDIKLMSKTGWGKNPGTNESGFTALPGGFKGASEFSMSIKNYANFWTATKADEGKAWSRSISLDSPGFGRAPFPAENGLSVRCVKNR
jgi:uncharacterized protein (TIGR02145 family)